MTPPTCCGVKATRYFEVYDGGSFEQGFKCRRCGRIRIPYDSPGVWHPFPPFTAEQHAVYMENLRAEGYEIVA